MIGWRQKMQIARQAVAIKRGVNEIITEEGYDYNDDDGVPEHVLRHVSKLVATRQKTRQNQRLAKLRMRIISKPELWA